IIRPFNTKNCGGAGAKTRKAGDGQTSPTTVARPTETTRTSGADTSSVRNHGLRATGSAGRVPSRDGRPPARARHTHATMSTTGNSVMTATMISARPPARSTRPTAPNISATKRRLHAAKTLNLVPRDGSRKHKKTMNATKLTPPSTRAWCWAALIARRTCRRRGAIVSQAAGEKSVRSPQIGFTLPERLPGERVSSRELFPLLEGQSLERGLLRIKVVFVGVDQEVAGGQMSELVQDGQGQDQRGQAARHEDSRQVHRLRVPEFPEPAGERKQAREFGVPGVRDHMNGNGDIQVISECVGVIFGLEPPTRETQDGQFFLKLGGREQGPRSFDARPWCSAEVPEGTPQSGQPVQEETREVTSRHFNPHRRPRVLPRTA